MASTPALLSLDEYLRTDYSPDADYVDGVIEERNLGERDHGRIQSFITTLFTNQEDEWQVIAIVEQRIRVADGRVRVCDLAVLRADAPYEPVTATPPLLCIEIMSPEDRLARAKLVLADYFAMGVKNIWLIDPLRRAAYTFDANGLQIADPTHLTIPGTPIHLDLTGPFAKLDKDAAKLDRDDARS